MAVPGYGNAYLNMYIVDLGDVAFLLNATTYPLEIDPVEGAKAGAEGAVDEVNGTIVENRDIEFLGHPGREFVYTFTQEGTDCKSICRVVFIGDSMYHLQMMATTKYYDSYLQHWSRFVESFKLK
jgi:hypothetical protein